VPPAFHPDIEVFGGETVGRLRLNRPDRLNALTSPVMSAVIEAAEWFDTQTRIRAVVISGAGDSFCAGFDVAEFASLRGFEDAVPMFRLGTSFVDTVEAMRPVTVAALHGNVVGGGVPSPRRATCGSPRTTPSSRFPRSISAFRCSGTPFPASFARSARPEPRNW
jgi:1,4-dihydroxy-2-naphthoyl-CoA synthase